MADKDDNKAAENPVAKMHETAMADTAYQADPTNPVALMHQADALGVNLDTSAPIGGTGFTGGLADFGRGLAHGVISDLPMQVGQAAQFFGAKDTGDKLVAFAKAQDVAHPELKQSQIGQIAQEDPFSVRGGASGAGTNTPLSVGGGLAGAGVGAGVGAFLGPGGALAGAGIGYAAGSIASLPIFYGSQGQQTYEKVKEARMKPVAEGGMGEDEAAASAQARIAGHIAGTEEAGGELIQDMIPISKFLKPFAKPIEGAMVKTLLGGGPKRAAKTIGQTMLGEVATEMAQQAAESETEGRFGAGPGATWKDTASVIMPTALMTLIPGGLAASHNLYSEAKVKRALANGSADPDARAVAAATVFRQIKDAGPNGPTVARAFDQYAADKIAAGQPIAIADDQTYLDHWQAAQQAAAAGTAPAAGGTAGPGAGAGPGGAGPPPGGFAQTPEDLALVPQTPSQQAGIDPASGPLSEAAATALDGGATQTQGKQFPFVSEAAAQARANATGGVVTKHPSVPGHYAVQSQAEIDAAEAQGDALEAAAKASEKVTTEAAGAGDKALKAEEGAAQKAGEAAMEPAPVLKPGEKAEPKPTKAETKVHTDALERTIEETQNQIAALISAGPQGGFVSAGQHAERIQALERKLADHQEQLDALGGPAEREEPAPTTTPAPTISKKVQETEHAVQKPSTAGVLQREPGQVGEPGGERGRVEPGEQRPEAAGKGEAQAPVQRPGEGVAGHKEDVAPKGETTAELVAKEQARIAAKGKGGPVSWMDKPLPKPPTTAQAEAGNFQKDHISVSGLPISVENREGSQRTNLRDTDLTEAAAAIPAEARTGTQPGGGEVLPEVAHQRLTQAAALMREGDHIGALKLAQQAAHNLATASADTNAPTVKLGKQLQEKLKGTWARKIARAHYGYIKGTVGKDKDHIDTFVKPGTKEDHAGPVYVIDQVNKAGGFDEHKVMIGYPSKLEAIGAYKANYPKDFKVGKVHETTTEGFKEWLKSGDTKKAFAEHAKAAAQAERTAAKEAKQKAAGEAEAAKMEEQFQKNRQRMRGTPWEKSREFEVKLDDGRTVKVEYESPETAISGSSGGAHFEFRGEAASSTGYRSDFVNPEVLDSFPSPEAYAKAKAETLAVESKKDRAAKSKAAQKAIAKMPVGTRVYRGDYRDPTGHFAGVVSRIEGDKIEVKWNEDQKIASRVGGHEGELEGPSKWLRGLIDPVEVNPFPSDEELAAAKAKSARTEAERKAAFLASAKEPSLDERIKALEDEYKSADTKRSYDEIADELAPLVAERDRLERENEPKPTLKGPKFKAGDEVWITEHTTREVEKRYNVGGKYETRKETVAGGHRTPGWTVVGYDGDQVRVEGNELQGTPPVWTKVERLVPERDLSAPRVQFTKGQKAVVTPQVPALEGMTPLGTKEKTADEGPTSGAPALPAPAAAPFAKNTIFTADKVEAARARLKAKLGTMTSGIDPETLTDGMTIAGAYIEAGVRDFATFSKKMIEDFGEAVRPYLRSFYEGVRFYPGLETEGMSTAAEIEQLQAAEKTTTMEPHGTSKPEQRELRPLGPEGVPGPQGEGGNVEPATKPADDRGVEARPPGDVRAPGEGQHPEGDGGRAPKQDVGGGEQVPGGRDGEDGRNGASGAGVADAGPGERRPNTGQPPAGQPAPAKQPGLGNYHIADPAALFGGGPKARFAKNRAAIEALNLIKDESREATPAERDALAAYTGWGSFGQELFKGSWNHEQAMDGWGKESTWLRNNLGKEAWESAQRSILNAHYTDPPTVQTMWSMLQRMGFTGGRILEPSIGSGNFFGLMPREIMARSNLAGIELDSTTGRIAQILYPDANIQIKGYQESKTADNFYDLIVGNWPFAKDGPSDRRYNEFNPSLHDYFFIKALDQVRPGGLVVGITSNGTMDKRGTTARRELARKGELIAAYRLPTGAFQEYAGTKVVTDIIVLRKRAAPLVDVSKEGWIESHDVPTANGQTIHVNEYWDAHPDNVLGEMTWGRGTTSGQPGMIVNRLDDFPAKLASLPARLPEDVYTPAPKQLQARINYVTNNTTDRERSVIVGDKGALMVVQGEYLAPLHEIAPYAVKSKTETAARAKQIEQLIGLRKAFGALLDAERDGAPNIEALRAEVAKQYQAFTKAHGPVNKSFGLSLLQKIRDPFYPMLASLELAKGIGKKRTFTPARILSESTMRAKQRMENPSIADAFVLSRNGSLDVDPAAIAALAKKTEAEVISELTGNNAIFRTPAGTYEVSDVYLSGNVRRKLREAQEAAAAGQDMTRQIDALQKVIPKDVPYFQIEAKLGAPWVSAKNYEAFVHELLGVEEKEKAGVHIENRLGSWRVELHHDLQAKPEAKTVHGVPYYPFSKLLRAAMNNTAITIRTPDEHGDLQFDAQRTTEANLKATALRDRFPDWLWSDIDRRRASEIEYNEAMNAIAKTQFDGSFLSFAGMALQRGENQFSLREHQANAIWRGLVNKSGIYAHEVGTGKTYTMGGLAIEARRYGLAKKPLLFAHNANSATVAREIQEMYPGAKILYIDNLDPGRIDVTMRQIANDDWDTIVVPHSLIDRFALKEETLKALAATEIAQLEEEAIEAAEADNATLSVSDMDDEKAMKNVRSSTAKELVKARNAILKKISDMAIRSSKEDAIAFEDLGVDMITVDEAHEFKKPPLATRMNLKGLNKGTSNKAISLRFLTDYVKGMNGGTGVHVFTGTVITNTLNEIYNMQRFVADSQMARDGVKDWDAWFNTFADSVTDVELTAAATYEPVTRLASFVNTAELRRMIGGYTDIVFADDMPEFKPRETASGKNMRSENLTPAELEELKNGRQENPIGRPYKQIINDVAPMSPAQQSILAELVRLATAFKTDSPRGRRNRMLGGHPSSPVIVETSAAAAGLDPRMYDLSAENTPDLKINRATKNILMHYNEHPLATQAVFVERGYNSTAERSIRGPDQMVVRDAAGRPMKQRVPTFNLVQGLVDNLVAGGIPREQIAIVSGEMTKEKRKETADRMNAAEIRVVIGMSTTLGTGVNMQDNLRAMHHLDAPWMPGLLEQRNGRGWRQGNQWNTVKEYRYITDRVDGRRWQVLAVKDRFIKAFLTADENVRVIEGDAVGMDEEEDILSTLSEAAGDPRILLKEKFKKDVERLQTKQRYHEHAREDAKNRIVSVQREIKQLDERIARVKGDVEQVKSYDDKPFEATFQGKTITDRTAFNVALTEWVGKLQVGTKWEKIGQVRGFDLMGRWPHADAELQLQLETKDSAYSVRPSIASMEGTLRSLDTHAEADIAKRDSLTASIPRLQEASVADFPRKPQLERSQQLLAQLEADLATNPVPPPIWLRQGTPAKTVIYVNGRELEVEGHQWAQDGFYVLVNAKEGLRRVPYMDAKDSSGVPIYEPHPFAAPVRPPRVIGPGTILIHKQTGTAVKAVSAVIERQHVEPMVRVEETAGVVKDVPVKDYEMEALPEPTLIPLLGEEAPKLSLGRGGKYGTTALDAQREITPLIRTWRNAPRVRVVQSVANLPFKVPANTRGVFHSGVAYLVADNLKKGEAHGVLLHEVVGHYGLKAILGDAREPLMERLYNTNETVRRMADARIAAAARHGETYSKALGAEEALADLAKDGKAMDLPMWKMLVAAIRNALRRIGFNVEMSDNDIAALLGESRRYVERRPGSAPQKLQPQTALLSLRFQQPLLHQQPQEPTPARPVRFQVTHAFGQYRIRDNIGDLGFVGQGYESKAEADKVAMVMNAEPRPLLSLAGEVEKKMSYSTYQGVAREERARAPVLGALQKMFAPASRGPIAVQQAGIMRMNLAVQARRKAVAEVQMKDYAAIFDKMPIEDQIKFTNDYERNIPQTDPKLAEIAAAIKDFNDERRISVQALGKGQLQNFNEFYLGRIWKQPEATVALAFGRRPLEGSKGFLKRRKYEYFSEGLDADLTPITYNPIEMMLIKGIEVDRYVYAQKIFAEMKAARLAKFVRQGTAVPDGWVKINDRIAQVQFHGTEGMVQAGAYYAPEEAATLINNHLGPGLQGNGAYDIVRKAGTMLNGAQLGLSAFHAGFTTLDAMVSKAALGVQQLSRGQFLKGAGSLLQSLNPAQPFINFYKGDRMLKAYLGQLQDPSLAPVIEALLAGGGRVKMDDFYRNTSINAFHQALRANDKLGIAKHLLPTMIDRINAPIFEQLVPRQKLGVFFDLAKDWIERNPNATLDEKRVAMGKAWDSVDNRLGQLVYDNVFWSRTLKDALMISVRSVGWNLGTFRELGGGVGDLRHVLRDKEASTRLGYVIALPFVTAILGSTVGFMFTGHGPDDLKDYFFPKTGKKRPDGTEDRLSLASYMKDIYEYGHDITGFLKYGADPTKTLQNKLHPLLGMVTQMLNNQDFFGAAIRNPGDPAIMQLEDEAKYLGTQFLPFGVRNFAQQQKVKGEKGVDPLGYVTSPSFIGITPSPGYITQTAQQTEAAALGRMKDALISKFRQEVRDEGAVPPDLVRRMLNAGLRPNEVHMVITQGLQQTRVSRQLPRQLHDNP